jgi:CheY-like chemotaxis protein
VAKILIIDDEEDVRDAIRLILERAGHDVTIAPNSFAGLALLEQQPMDIVMTDIVMPGQNGVETIRQLRQDFPRMKIIAISGGGNLGPAGYQPGAIKTAAYLAAAKSAGADLACTKPFDRQELLNAIEQASGETR